MGLDHLCAMIAVGLCAAQRGGKAAWLLPATFLVVMTVGGALGAAGVTLPGVEPGIAASVLVLPCDLPDLDPRALDALAHAALEGDIAIAPDESGTGTNALVVPALTSFEFRFGAESCARHCEAAAAHGLSVVVHRSPAIAFDIDTPADYARIVCSHPDDLVKRLEKLLGPADAARVALAADVQRLGGLDRQA